MNTFTKSYVRKKGKMPFHFVKEYLNDWFGYPENKVYCQVSTSFNGSPHIRTMDLYHITEEGDLILMTETNTRKWHDLKTYPHVAICILCLDRGQILVEGKAILKTNANDRELSQLYWYNFLDQYWRDFYLSRITVKKQFTNEIPDSFGVIVVKPHFWEILEINNNDFLKSSRKQFHFENHVWVISDVLPV